MKNYIVFVNDHSGSMAGPTGRDGLGVKHTRELGKILGAAGQFTPHGAFIAGGALTSAFSNKEINDVDYYFKSEQAFYEAIKSAYDEGWWVVSATDRSVTFAQNDLVIQLVYFEYFDSAKAVFDAFDFTCCMGAYDIDAKDFVFHDKFLKHVAQRHLSFHEGTRFPFVSLLRVSKYQQKGYSIGHGDILRIALRCHGIKLETWEDLSRAIGGHYGDKALKKELLSELQQGHEKFSIEAAMNLLRTDGVIVEVEAESLPSKWEEMIRYVELLKTQPGATYRELPRQEFIEWQRTIHARMDAPAGKLLTL